VMVTNSFTSLNAYFTRELEYRKPFLVQSLSFAISVAVKIVLVSVGLGVWGSS